MRGLVVFLMVAVAGTAFAGEKAAPGPDATEAQAVAPAESAEAEAAEPAEPTEPAPAAAATEKAIDEAAAPAEPEPAGPRPQFRFADLAVQLAKRLHPGAKADLYAPAAPPLVVADGFGLLVQRRFGR